MVLPEAHASEGKPISSPGRSRFTDSLAPPRTQQSISLKHRLHSTSKLDLRDHCSDHGSVRPQNPRMLLTKKNPFLFLVTRFFFLETNSRFRWPKAATATSGVHPTVFSLPRWQPGDAPPSTMRRGSFSPPSSLGGVVSNGPATMDPSSPPLTPPWGPKSPTLATPQFLFASDPTDSEGGDDSSGGNGPSQRPYETLAAVAASLGSGGTAMTIDSSFSKKHYKDMVAAAVACPGVVLISWQHEDIPWVDKKVKPGISQCILLETGTSGSTELAERSARGTLRSRLGF